MVGGRTTVRVGGSFHRTWLFVKRRSQQDLEPRSQEDLGTARSEVLGDRAHEPALWLNDSRRGSERTRYTDEMDQARSLVTAALLVGLTVGSARAEVAPPPAASPIPSRPSEPPPSPAEQRYARERKSPGLALTLEALSPVAGAGSLYAGTEGDRAAFLAVLSALAAGAAVGGVFWLVHLDGERASGFSRAALDLEQGGAISLLVTAGLVYLLARASGLSLASDAIDSFNRDLQRRLAVP